MRRILILGGPGAGKSTLARALGRRLTLPVIHMDQLFWSAGWVAVPKPVLVARVAAAAAAPAWVFEGNNALTFATRADRADLIVFLDLPVAVRLPRIVRRIFSSLGKVRPDLAPGCPERVDLGFLWWSVTWGRRHRPKLLALAETRAGQPPLERLTTPRQVAAFLDRVAPQR